MALGLQILGGSEDPGFIPSRLIRFYFAVSNLHVGLDIFEIKRLIEI